jgi:hypothetical protein
MKPFSPTAKSSRTDATNVLFDQAAGFDHVGPHPQRNLPPIPQVRPSRRGKPGRTAMTEIVTAVLVFLSITVFLAHTLDAYRVR